MKDGNRSASILLSIVAVALLVIAGCADTPEPLSSGTPVTVSQTPASGHPPHYHPLYTSSLLVMQKNAPEGQAFSLPTFLPDGFFFTFGSVPQGPAENPFGNGVFEFTYTRGRNEEVLLVEQFRNSTKCPDRPVFQSAFPGSLRAARGETGELTWGDDRWCYLLTGTLPREDLEKIGASVQPVPYREDVTPPYEFIPPANPLIARIPANVSFSTGRDVVTIESLQCTPESCTIMIRIAGSTPFAVTPSPVVTLPPSNPDLQAVWQVDGGRPLLTMPGGGYSYNATTVLWKIEPLPAGSRTLSATFTSIRGVSGSWHISLPLGINADTGSKFRSPQ